MGSLSFTGRRNIKMKAVALFSLIAVAFAEPEAKADPWLTYGYGHLGYAGYGHAYAGYPYAHSVYYGKREAEPKADADAYLTYGAYGLGYGHAYGYGYPYAHHGVYY